MEHTPGPWEADNSRQPQIYDETGKTFALVVAMDEHAEANAQLIAAAPELLETLNCINGLIGNVDHSKGNGENSAKLRGDLLNDISKIAQAAIKAAGG